MRNKHEEIVEALHGFADWLEKSNHVHCDSLPRKAAHTITRLEEENHQMRLRLNKKYYTIRDFYDRCVGSVRFLIYKLQQRRKGVKR